MRTSHGLAILLPLPLLSLAALTLLLVASCGKVDPVEAGWKALQSGDHTSAVKHLESAMQSVETSSAEYLEYAVGHCQALAYTDPAAAFAAFEGLAENTDIQLTAKEHKLIVRGLLDAEAYLEAVKAADFSEEILPDDEKLTELRDKVRTTALKKAEGDEDLASGLEGLGYGGG